MFVGCSPSTPDRVAVYPVKGRITRDGQPLAGAWVVLHPKQNSQGGLLPARGSTDANGEFRATTYETEDGAAEGEYRVTVELFEPIEIDGSLVPGPNVLNDKLAIPESSGIIAHVAQQENVLEPIDVAR